MLHDAAVVAAKLRARNIPIKASSDATLDLGFIRVTTALPADYKSRPVFLKEVRKPDAVRDPYGNPVEARTAKGQVFPNGTQFVMEIYKAKKAVDGSLEKDAVGKLV